MSVPGKVFPSLREALHHTATSGVVPMKALAAELDWSPSQLSMATTLGTENPRTFPADDEHLLRLIQRTGDHSFLLTLADLLHCEVRPKVVDVPGLLQDVQREIRVIAPKLQMVLDMALPNGPTPGGARRR